MKKEHIIKAWRNREFYESLSESERALLPAHPAGVLDLDDEDLSQALGGATRFCPEFTSGYCTPCAPIQCY
jgi:mersacidin/lichenicidin family type 2 lantibiotic